jgi:hypothetical protein
MAECILLVDYEDIQAVDLKALPDNVFQGAASIELGVRATPEAASVLPHQEKRPPG